jgi:hypothetical protein
MDKSIYTSIAAGHIPGDTGADLNSHEVDAELIHG